MALARSWAAAGAGYPLRQGERRLIEEAQHGVARQARDRIIVIVVRQAGDEADRAGGKDGAALRRLEEDDVGLDAWIERTVDAARVRQHLLVDQKEGVGVVLRRGDDERVRRRAEPRIIGVDLQPGGAVA